MPRHTRRTFHGLAAASVANTFAAPVGAQPAAQATSPALAIDWEKNFLIITGSFPGSEMRINYLEAYCRPGSTDADWGKHTVIPHRAEKLAASRTGSEIRLINYLADGVVVRHTITARGDEIDFALTAENPTDAESQAHWAQPCIRLDKFTGRGKLDYVPLCFVFIDGKLTRLPTMPWATQARYVPGQVYCPKHVPRTDVNPRPLSTIVPSNGLCGCFSGDEQWVMATAWEPYQELFQGVATCMHSDFRIGGLKPRETKHIRGKLYLVRAAEIASLVTRYERDFPEHRG